MDTRCNQLEVNNPSGLNTILSGGILSNLNDPILDHQGATLNYVQMNSGSGIPGGPLHSIQYNDNGVFGGNSELTYQTDTLLSNYVSNGTVTIGSGTIDGLVDPINGQDAANKNYVDNNVDLVVHVINTVGSVVYTGNQLVNGMVLRDTGMTGVTIDTFPSAASIIAAGSLSLNSVAMIYIKNTSTDLNNILQFAMGAGITSEGSTPNIYSGYQYTGLMLITNVTPTLESISLYNINNSVTDTIGNYISYGPITKTLRSYDYITTTNNPQLIFSNQIEVTDIENKIILRDIIVPEIMYLPTPDKLTGIDPSENPTFWSTGGIDIYIMNISTTLGADITLDGFAGTIPWTMDPNSNMIIPPGYTGHFILYIDITAFPDATSIQSAKVYTIGIYPSF
jgi:hypothetical protein